MKKYICQIIEKHIEGLTIDGKGSERRIVTAWVTLGLLFCTVFVCVWTKQVNEVIFGEWIAYIGFNGYRTRLEKKDAAMVKKEPVVSEVKPVEPVKEGV